MEQKSNVKEIRLAGDSATLFMHDGRVLTKDTPEPVTDLRLASSKPLCEQSRVARQQQSAPSDFGEAVTLMLKQGHDPRKAIAAAATRWPTLYQRYVAELQRIDD